MKTAIIMAIMAVIMAIGVSAVVEVHHIDFYRGEGNMCSAMGDYYGGALGDWGVAPEGTTGYGGEGRDHFCMIVGPEDCTDTDTWVFEMNPTEPVNMLKVRYLDGQVDDTFSIYVKDDTGASHFVGTVNAPAGGGEVWRESDWFMLPITIPAGEVHQIEFVAEAPIEPWCEEWGQIAIDWVDFDYEEEIPEFGVLAGSAALLGALVGLVLLRRKF